MEKNLRNKMVYGLMTNETIIQVFGKPYVLKHISPAKRFEAEEMYERAVYENRFNTWLTDHQVLQLLVHNGLCSADIDSNLKEIDKVIEDHKIRLFKSAFSTDDVKKIRNTLNMVRSKQEQMLDTRHSLDHLTLKGFGEMVKQQFIMFHSLYNIDGSKVWEEATDIDIKLLELAMVQAARTRPSVAQFRELARTDPWRSYWNISKGQPFGVSPIELTEDQRTLIMFTKMYDSAYEHPECPPDDILKDDDMFDGWMISNQRKNEKEKMTHQLEDRFAKHGDAQEIFIPVKNKEQARKINELNDTQGVMVKAQREAALKKAGKLRENQLPDKRIEIQAQANQQYIDKVKGK